MKKKILFVLIIIIVIVVFAAWFFWIQMHLVTDQRIPAGTPQNYQECIKAGGKVMSQLSSPYPPQCIYGKYHYFLGTPGVYLEGQFPDRKLFDPNFKN